MEQRLHFAVLGGSLHIMPHILGSGADPHALSDAATEKIDMELVGRRLTSGELGPFIEDDP